MKKKILKEDLFFSMTWDYLNIYLPTQHQDSPKTVEGIYGWPYSIPQISDGSLPDFHRTFWFSEPHIRFYAGLPYFFGRKKI